jgi:hypothetical protein
MAHDYHQRQLRKVAEAKTSESGSTETASAASQEAKPSLNVNHESQIDEWNPNRIVYRKVCTRLSCEKLN